MKSIALLVIAALLAPGCTTIRPIELPQQELRSGLETLLKPGDRVRIRTTEGTVVELEVDRITPTHLVGYRDGRHQHGRIEMPREWIQSVDQITLAKAKTAAAVAAGVGVVLIAVGLSQLAVPAWPAY